MAFSTGIYSLPALHLGALHTAGRETNCSCTCKAKGKCYLLQICVTRLESTKPEQIQTKEEVSSDHSGFSVSLTMGISLCEELLRKSQSPLGQEL